jgi:hypothetical protein
MYFSYRTFSLHRHYLNLFVYYEAVSKPWNSPIQAR